MTTTNFKIKPILFYFSILFLFHFQIIAQTKPAILLSSKRETFIQNKYNTNEQSAVIFLKQADRFLSFADNSYGAGEKAAALALAYRITRKTDYRDKAKANFMATYINGDFNFKGRNQMRWDGGASFMTFTWLYNEWSAAEKKTIVDTFNVWAQYWIEHSNPGVTNQFRLSDSDHVTFLSEMYLLLGICLENEAATTRIKNTSTPLKEVEIVTTGGTITNTSKILFAKTDWILNDMVVAKYMNDYMKGGLWSEGTHYTPGTVQHWMRAFLVNKEIRNIPFPSNYYEDIVKTTIHTTFPNFNGMYQYGDIEGVAHDGNYISPIEGYRYNMMLHLFAMQKDETLKGLIQDWIHTAKAKNPEYPSISSNYTGLWPLLFEDETTPKLSPQEVGLNTTFSAEGENFIATRTDWTKDANILYFSNGIPKVDHEHTDALSFDIFHKSTVITKEVTGYSAIGSSHTSTAHNTLLIENESTDGSSSPKGGRGAGDGVNRIIASTPDYTYIEADATQVYNRGQGYKPDIYLDNVVRKITFLKKLNMVVVYDKIDIKETKGPRWTKYIQHFLKEPILTDGVFNAVNEGSRFFLKPMYPQNAVISKVNESVLWAGESESKVPLNQRKWHLSITNPNSPNDASYLNVLFFDDESVTKMPSTQLIHIETSNVSTNNVIGTLISDTNEDVVVLFNNDPSGGFIKEPISYSYNTPNNSKHYIFGVDKDTGYTITSKVSDNTVTITASLGGTMKPSNNGVLSFNIHEGALVINDPEVKSEIILAPNPTKNIFTINLNGHKLNNVTIYNNIGQLIKKSTLNSLNISDLSAGTYLVKIALENGIIITKKMIKY